MNAIYYGTDCWTQNCSGTGPWVGGDLENGMYFSNTGANPTSIPSEDGTFVSAWEKNNGTTDFSLKYGNGQEGGLTESYSGALPSSYDPMKVPSRPPTTTPAASGWASRSTRSRALTTSYRSDGADLETTSDTQDTSGAGAGYDIGWTGDGQWYNYTVDVATAGTYNLSLRLASPNAITDGLRIENSSGTDLSGPINVPSTGGFQDWTTVNTTVTLPAGEQTLRIAQDNGGWNIHFLSFAGSS